MKNWLKWLGGGKDDAAPKLDPPDVTARRVEAKRLADMAEWLKVKAQGPLGPKVTRQDVEHVLAAQCYKKRQLQGESLFVKEAGDRSLSVWISLETIGESELYPPMQQLLLSGKMTTDAYSGVEAEIFGDASQSAVVMASVGQHDVRDYVLSASQVGAAIERIEQELLALDAEAVLAEFRAFAPSRPGAAGLRHLAALALAGDIDTLDDYVRRRRAGDSCGFVPFITDDMITRAAKIGHRYG